MEMTRDEFIDSLNRIITKAKYASYCVGQKSGERWRGALNEIIAEQDKLMDWFDWAQPLIELGLATQQAQEAAQQD